MAEKVVRISVTIPEKLYREFESVAKKTGFKKRSKAVSEALKDFISEHKRLDSLPKASCTGTITFTYLHGTPGLLEALTEVQHKYSKVIAASLHVHLDPERCLETVVIKGDTETFREMVEKLRTMRIDKLQYVVIPQR